MMTGLNDVWNSRGDLKYENMPTNDQLCGYGSRLLGQPVFIIATHTIMTDNGLRKEP